MGELFSAFGLDLRLLLVQGLNFGLLLVALWFFLYKPLLNMLREREQVIAKGLEDAQEAEKERTQIEEARSAKMHEAETEAKNIVAQAKMYADDEKVRIVKDAEVRAEGIVKDAEVRGDELAQKAKKDAEKDIARLAVLAAENVLKEKKA